MKTIEANTTLYTRAIGDHNIVYDIKVLSRTAKSAKVLYEGSEKRTKIFVDSEGNEYLRPENYSMAPIFRAGNTTKPLADWER